jgi:hypothetical protein
MSIVIKKRVDLDFLGGEYKEAYLTFQSIPAIDYDQVVKDLKSVDGKEEGAVSFILEVLKKYFVSGKFPDDSGLQDVTKEDLNGLDPATLTKCFQVFTGAEIDPKAETPLTSSSPTVESPPENL